MRMSSIGSVHGWSMKRRAVFSAICTLCPVLNWAALRRTMIRMLSEWKATIDWFIRVTDVDWTFDTETEQVLKGIVTKLSRSFEPYASP
jgi:hypothetical protein